MPIGARVAGNHAEGHASRQAYKPCFLLRQAARTLPSAVQPFFARSLSRTARFELNAGVRVTTGSMVAFGIVIAAVVLAAVALFVRPPPPSLRPPTSRPAGSTTHAPPEVAPPISALYYRV